MTALRFAAATLAAIAAAGSIGAAATPRASRPLLTFVVDSSLGPLRDGPCGQHIPNYRSETVESLLRRGLRTAARSHTWTGTTGSSSSTWKGAFAGMSGRRTTQPFRPSCGLRTVASTRASATGASCRGCRSQMPTAVVAARLSTEEDGSADLRGHLTAPGSSSQLVRRRMSSTPTEQTRENSSSERLTRSGHPTAASSHMPGSPRTAGT